MLLKFLRYHHRPVVRRWLSKGGERVDWSQPRRQESCYKSWVNTQITPWLQKYKTLYISNYDSKRREYRNRRPFLGWRKNDRQSNNPNQPRKLKQAKAKWMSLPQTPFTLIMLSVRTRSLAVPNDKIGGRSKQFLPQWRCLISDWFILDSVQHYKILFAETPEQESVPKDIKG